jgi:quinol-cytochrome oxidoreductase complex cytochrome b subunit
MYDPTLHFSIFSLSGSQQPRGLRRLKHELSSLALTLESLVRIPLRAWMLGVCVHMCVFAFILCLCCHVFR